MCKLILFLSVSGGLTIVLSERKIIIPMTWSLKNDEVRKICGSYRKHKRCGALIPYLIFKT